MSQVLSRSPKGLREATGKTDTLSEELLEVLKACKGQFEPEQVAAAWPEKDRKVIVWAISELVTQGYLREVEISRSAAPAPGAPSAPSAPAEEGFDLDFSAAAPSFDAAADDTAAEQARRDAEENARRDADARARRDAEERVRRETE